MAVLAVAINLSGNLVIAEAIKHTPGFEQVPIGQLVIFWCSRPRLAWMVVLIAIITNVGGREDFSYIPAAVSSIVSEIVLQAIAAFPMGTAISHAVNRHFYLVGHLSHVPHASDALLMYSGALLWMVSVGFAMFWAIYIFTPAVRRVRMGLKALGRGLRLLWAVLKRNNYNSFVPSPDPTPKEMGFNENLTTHLGQVFQV
ncbi:hypothetical protein GP486_003917 [Trichoglossum hirsutum]|uniref:Uncharacterized protein n=1 Tax=Trichoglossum hirsutum TaxID=265104 RepID=A0A9P8LC56_9PEZI|nr:hypothetical protein GP486_003917 [Trichoglossum hirsutum]